MPPTIMALDTIASSGGVQPFLYTGSSPALMGGVLPGESSDSPTVPGNLRRANLMCQFDGGRYAFGVLGIYKLQPNDSDWDKTTPNGGHTFPSPETSADGFTVRGGFHVVYIGDVPRLVGFYQSSTSAAHLRGFTFDGTTFVDLSDMATGVTVDGGAVSGAGIQQAIVYRNVVHFKTTDAADNIQMRTWDPATDSYAAITSPLPSGVNNTALCVFDDRLLMVYPDSRAATASWRIAEYIGGTWLFVQEVDTGFDVSPDTDATNHQGRPSLFTDGTALYGMLPGLPAGQSNRGWRLYSFNASLTPSNITATVLPAALISVDDGGSANIGQSAGVEVYVDLEETAGTAIIWLYQSNSSAEGTPFETWLWNGNAALITSEDSGGDVQHALSFGTSVGGERSYTFGQPDILITGRIAASGGEQLSFQGRGGLTSMKVEFYISLEGEPPTTPAVLITTTATGGSATNDTAEVSNVDLDGTVYTVVVDAVASGFGQGQRLQYVARVFP